MQYRALKVTLKSASFLAGTLLLATTSSAYAGHNHSNFKEFRLQNPSIERHAARALFRESNDRQNKLPAASIVQPSSNRHADLRAARIGNQNMLDHLRARTNQINVSGDIVKLKSGLDLDLTSNSRNITLGKNLFATHDSVEITSGEGTKTVTAGSQVTAAEYIAVKQALSGDGQKLIVDRSGRAIGGNVNLDAITGDHDVMRAANLVVANNVTTSGDFSRRSDFRLLGDLNNFGTVLALSGSSNARQGAIHADDINNFRGATINSNIDLTLDASGTLSNAGTIASSAGLTLTAGNTVNNYGSITAAKDLSFAAPNVNNHGSIASTAGNVNLRGASDAALVVNNQHGVISALNGAVNLRESDYNGAFDSKIIGGDLFSKQFNLNSGMGTAFADVNQVTGIINETGSAAHVIASTDNLQLGSVCLTGDPTFFNRNGDITITGNVSVAEALVVVSTSNIEIQSGVTVSAGDASSKGFDITLIAGADFTNQGGNNKSTLPALPADAGIVTLSGKSSKTGGNIQMDAGSSILARATDTSGNTNGGNVSLFAFDGRGTDGQGGGTIDTTNGTISTGGSGTGFNGFINIVGGASKAQSEAVRTGTLSTTGGSSGVEGSISIRTSDVVSSNKKVPIVYAADGSRTSTSFLTGAEKLNRNADLVIAGPINSTTTFQASAGRELYVQGAINANQLVILSAGTEIKDGGGPPPITSATQIQLFAGKEIGSSSDPLNIIAPSLLAECGGTGVNIQVNTGSPGALNIAQITAQKAEVSITAADRDITATGSILSKSFDVTAANLVSFQDVTATDEARFTTAGSLLNSLFGGTVTTKQLSLLADIAIGTSVNPFNVAVPKVTAQAKFGPLFLNCLAPKGTILENTKAAAQAAITANGSLKLEGSSPLSVSNDIDITTNAGTLSISQGLVAGGHVTVTNSSTKGKMIVDRDISSGPTGDITISLGPTLVNTFTPTSNVNVSGNVLLTGNGFASSKTQTINLTGTAPTSVRINNGNKLASLTLGSKNSGVTINSND